MQERRKIPRNHLVHYLRLFDQETKAVLGNMIDISMSGIRMISEGAIPPGTYFKIHMDFPEEVTGKLFLTFEAVCVWCKPEESSNLFTAGCEFRKIADEDREILHYLIDLYQDEEV